MNHAALLLFGLVLFPASVKAEEKKALGREEFIDERSSKMSKNIYLEEIRKERQKRDEEELSQANLIQSARSTMSRILICSYATAISVPYDVRSVVQTG